jgi:hypothetical protein
MPIYEYMMIVSATTTNWSDIWALPESERPALKFTARQWIWRPYAEEAEERKEANVLVILNELGREGWKLAESTITHSTVSVYSGVGEQNLHGFTGDIGTPVQSRYILMREVRS